MINVRGVDRLPHPQMLQALIENWYCQPPISPVDVNSTVSGSVITNKKSGVLPVVSSWYSLYDVIAELPVDSPESVDQVRETQSSYKATKLT